MAALMEFTSHIQGKNAKVAIYPDRIEWEREGRITATRALGGALLTGSLRKGGSTEMIPIKAVTSVTTRKDGLRNYAVSIIAAGGEQHRHASVEGRGRTDQADHRPADLCLSVPGGSELCRCQRRAGPDPASLTLPRARVRLRSALPGRHLMRQVEQVSQ